jgi:hypothetical protein
MRSLILCLVIFTGCKQATSSDGNPDLSPSFPAPFTLKPLDNARITSQGGQPNYQQANATLDLQAGPFSSVKLTLDLASTCFPFDNWMTDKPPAGQNWPADCDAFDRNLDVTLDDPVAMTDPPAFDVIHAITPFGGPEHIEIDLTDLANARPGKHALRVTIPTYSDSAGKVSGSNGGWNVSVTVDVTPGPAPRNVLAAIPLVWTTQSMPTSPPPVSFMVPSGTATARLEVRASGHGGANTNDPNCIGPAEEFCHRQLDLTVDGKSLTPAIDPWRDDCDQLCTMAMYAPFKLTYCMENPCGAIQSVQAPRANWCPGSMTAPFTWDADALHAVGAHTFSWSLSTVASGGGWQISAIYYAFGE